MEQIELRKFDSDFETQSNGELLIEGLVNKTDTWSRVLGKNKKFIEKINKGVFAKAIEKAARVDFLGEHSANMLLATTENNSLSLWESERGLEMRAEIVPTSYGKDLHTLIKNKLINHMSFGFKVKKDSWKRGNNGIFERTIEEIELREVSAVRNPCYEASAISARGFELVEEVQIPEEFLEIEERSMDIEAIKAQIKEELLNEMVKKAADEAKAKEVTVEEVQVKPEEKKEVIEPVVTKEPQKIEEKVVEKVVESKVEEVIEEKPSMADLFNKFKEIQNLK